MKTNKIKPIKKIMIFTIITVMIVSLFAVPAFAGYDASTGQFSVDQTMTLEEFGQVFPNPPDLLIGKYCFMVSSNNLQLASRLAGMSAVGDYEFLAQPLLVGIAGNDDNLLFGHSTSINFVVESIDPIIDKIEVVIDGVAYETLAVFFAFDSLDILSYFTTYGQDAVQFVAESDALQVLYIESDDTTPPADGEEQGIFAVWSKITQWIVQGLASVSNAFYADGKLTLLGTLCIIPIALGIAFLLIAIIQKFLRLRG